MEAGIKSTQVLSSINYAAFLQLGGRKLQCVNQNNSGNKNVLKSATSRCSSTRVLELRLTGLMSVEGSQKLYFFLLTTSQ